MTLLYNTKTSYKSILFHSQRKTSYDNYQRNHQNILTAQNDKPIVVHTAYLRLTPDYTVAASDLLAWRDERQKVLQNQ
jgi:hypothetical protein